MHSSKTKGLIRTLDLSNDCNYWRCVLSGLKVHASYDRRVTDQNMHHNLFPVRHFVLTFNYTGRTWTFYILNDSATIGDTCIHFLCYSWMRMGSGAWVMAPNKHRSLFPISHACMQRASLHTKLENLRSYKDVQYIERLLDCRSLATRVGSRICHFD